MGSRKQLEPTVRFGRFNILTVSTHASGRNIDEETANRIKQLMSGLSGEDVRRVELMITESRMGSNIRVELTLTPERDPAQEKEYNRNRDQQGQRTRRVDSNQETDVPAG